MLVVPCVHNDQLESFDDEQHKFQHVDYVTLRRA